jgi:hypothetical protein
MGMRCDCRGEEEPGDFVEVLPHPVRCVHVGGRPARMMTVAPRAFLRFRASIPPNVLNAEAAQLVSSL